MDKREYDTIIKHYKEEGKSIKLEYKDAQDDWYEGISETYVQGYLDAIKKCIKILKQHYKEQTNVKKEKVDSSLSSLS
jgi:hypothetical protein